MAGVAIKNIEKKEIRVTSRLFFYGNHATNELAQTIANEITTLYNEPNAIVLVDNEAFNVIFDIQYVVVEDINDLVFLAKNNRDYRNNFIRIEEKNQAERSFMGFSIGDNTGHWLVSDNLGKSTTAAHEYGHSLGLDHPENLDFRGIENPPPIMAPRGSLVDAQYQWNPTVKAGEYGGTLQPSHRKVSISEIQSLFLENDFDNNHSVTLGKLVNTLYDTLGNRIVIS